MAGRQSLNGGAMNIGWTEVIAAYAAVVATGALFLEVRRWIESGPRLRLGILDQALMIGEVPRDPKTYISATVTNTGAMPTTLRMMGLELYSSRWKWLRRKPTGNAVVTRPGAKTGQELPFFLAPGSQWMGLATRDEGIERMLKENWAVYVCIYASHTARPLRHRMKAAEKTEADS